MGVARLSRKYSMVYIEMEKLLEHPSFLIDSAETVGQREYSLSKESKYDA